MLSKLLYMYIVEDRLKEEHDKWINTTAMGIEFVRKHPEYIEEYEKFSRYDTDDNSVGDPIEQVQWLKHVMLQYYKIHSCVNRSNNCQS